MEHNRNYVLSPYSGVGLYANVYGSVIVDSNVVHNNSAGSTAAGAGVYVRHSGLYQECVLVLFCVVCCLVLFGVV
jgi:hypothetical protein